MKTDKDEVGAAMTFCTDPLNFICQDEKESADYLGRVAALRDKVLQEFPKQNINKLQKTPEQYRRYMGRFESQALAFHNLNYELLFKMVAEEKAILLTAARKTSLRNSPAALKELEEKLNQSNLVKIEEFMKRNMPPSLVSIDCGDDGSYTRAESFAGVFVLCPGIIAGVTSIEELRDVIRHELSHAFDDGRLGWPETPALNENLLNKIYEPFLTCVNGKLSSEFTQAAEDLSFSHEVIATTWAIEGLAEKLQGISMDEQRKILKKTFSDHCGSKAVGHFMRKGLINVLVGENPRLRQSLGCPILQSKNSCSF